MFSLLYIDDEPGLLELGQLFLERTGEFTVKTALSADAGLACLAEQDFDAIISDYQMPGMDGISLLKNVRRSYGNIPFVLFTGRGREEIVIEAINNGVDFYLQKGGDPKAQFAELAHKVRQAVNRRQAETALSDSEKRLADIINFLPDATFAIDTQGVVIAWNRAMERMTGVSSAEILGKGNFEYAIPFYQEPRPLLINLVLDDDPALAAKYPFVKKEGRTLFSEITIPHFNDGRGAALWFTASPLYNRNGDVVGAIESIREVTERKQAEEDLVSANREYTNLLDQIQDVYYRSDTEGKLVKASRSWATLFGYDDISECLGRSIADDFYVNPSDRKQLLDEIYRNRKVTGYEVLLKKKDGTPVLVEASSHLSYDPAGTVIGIEGTFRDFTERKKGEDELRAAYGRITANEEKFRSIVETTPDIIWESDLQGKFRYISPRVAAIMGYTPEEVVGRSIIDLVPDEVKPFILQELPRYATLKESLLPLEVPARHRDGRELMLEIRPALAGTSVNPEGFRGVAVDITERKRAEEALKKSEMRFRELANLLPQGIYEADPGGMLTYVNRRALDMFMYTREDIRKGVNISSTIAAGDRQRVATAFGQIAEQATQPDTSTEYTGLRKDGSTFPIAIYSSPITRDGRVTGVRGIIMDITERKKAEDALSESEGRFRELSDLLPQGIYEADITGRLTYANRIALEMSGYTREDLRKGLNAMTVFAPEDRQRAAAVFSQMVEQGTRSPENTEYKALRKDGSTFPVSIFSSPVIRDGRIVGVRGVIMDITERKRAEVELRAVNEQLVASEEELRSQYDELAESEKRMRMSETRLTFMLGFYEFSQKSEKELLEYAIEGAGIVTGSPLGYLAFLNEDESELSMYAWSKTAMAECSMREKPIIYKTEKTGLWGEAVRKRRPVITNDYAAPNPAKKGYPDGHPHIIRHMNVPVIDEGHIVLVAGVANKPSDYMEKDASELLLLMQGLWTIIKRKRLQEEQRAAYEQLAASEEELQQQYEQLKKNEEELRMLKISVDQSADEVFWLDFEGNILNVNDTACRINGYLREEFLGKTIFDLNPDLTPDIWAGTVFDLRQKKTQLITTRHTRKDGATADVEIMAVYVNQDGREYSFAFVRDITGRRQAEEALRTRSEEYQKILQTAMDGFCIVAIDGSFIDVNDAFCTSLGYTREEVLSLSLPRIEIRENPEETARHSKDIISKGWDRFETRFRQKDGGIIDVEVGVVYTGMHGGRFITFSRDITRRRKETEELRLLKISADHSSDEVFWLDFTGQILYVNDAACRTTGYSRDELLKMKIFELDPDFSMEVWNASVSDLRERKNQFITTRHRRKDGVIIDVEIVAVYVSQDEREYSFAYVRDITERKRTGEALRESEEKCRTILDTTSEWIWDLDLHGCHTYSNPAVESLLGYTRDEILGISTFEMIHPDDRDRIEQIFASSVSKKSGWRNVRIRWLHKDGTYRFLESNATAIFNERGELTGFRGADRDITESVHAEDALRESEEKFRALVETTSDFIWEVDAAGVYTYVSPQVYQILGYEPDEMVGRTPFDFMLPEEIEKVTAEFNHCIDSRLPIVALENKAIRKDGSVVVLETSGVVRTANDGSYLGYRGIDRDITTRKEAAERTTRLSALKQDLIRTAPLEEKLKQITDGIVEIFGADFARIWMTGPGDLCDKGCIHAAVTKGPHICRNRKSCLHLIASSGRYTHTDGDHRRVPFGAYKIGRLASGEEAHFITNDVTHDPRVHDNAWAESLGLVSFTGFQLVSPDGEPIGVLAFFSREPITQDIVDDLNDLATTTSQVIQTGMAEEAQWERDEWARTILNTTQTGIVLIDAETHRILDANPKALGMIGLPRDSVIGRVCHYFICPAEKGNCPVTDGGQEVDTSERILVTAAETMIPVLKTVVSVSLGGKKVLVESFVDISEQKRSEAAIREVNRKLNLLSSITRHDVANQLTVIQGYTQLAALSNPEPVIADFLAKIESGIDTIQHQIEFTRTYEDLGVQAPAWFLIGDVIRSVGHEGIRLVCTCKSYEIYADPMIGRVFFNLFDNAVRYGERVTTVRAGCAKKGKKLVIRFADNGIGIPSNEKKKIFQKGYGKHTGFGLFLAREILAITGITIQETGIYDKGAVFEITVPEGSFRKAE